MATRRPASAFVLKPSALKNPTFPTFDAIAQWICTELDNAISARGGVQQEIQYAWALYQQDRTRGRNAPWPDAADLTSPMATEYTDALHARLMTTIFTEPVWTVEGFGASAAKAPFVEEFHQRAQEDERLQGYADEWVLRGLVEGVGILEVSEATEYRRETKQMRAKLQLDVMTGQPVMGEAGPLLEHDVDGGLVEAGDETIPSAMTEYDALEPVRLGPAYDIVPYLDSVTMPHHARDRHQVWGTAKRFWRRVPELEALAKRGVYDPATVKDIGTENERSTLTDEAPAIRTVPIQDGPTAQKELWECQVLVDFDGQGDRWWRLTVHKDKRKLLRLIHDDRTTRTIKFLPYPKPGCADRGYSLVTGKLLTVIEEDTAVRNMRADKAAMKLAQPVLRQVGALWDPYEQPLGPRSVVDVRDRNEISLLQGVEDVPNSIIAWKQDIRADAERLIGQNEIAQGQQTEERRTLGEVQLQAGYAEVRTNVLVRRFQESLEELFQVRHAIWQRTLANRQHLPTTRALVLGREARGAEVPGVATDGTVTAELLEGIFWGKPRGSVETADLNRQRADFNQFLQAIPAIAAMNPMIAAIFQTMPAAKALVKTMLKVNRVQDIQSFIGPESDGVFEQMQLAQDPRMQLLKQLAEMSGEGGAAGGPLGVTPGRGGPQPLNGGPPAAQPSEIM